MTLAPVIVETDEGISGVGEAGLQRRWKGIMGVIDHLKAWLIGEDPMRTEHLWQRMFRGGFYPADRLIGSVIAAIDTAFWDIKGQKLGIPVYELLGGRCRDYVQCFLMPDYRPGKRTPVRKDSDRKKVMTSALSGPEQIAAMARECVEAGHKFFRLGLSQEGHVFEPRREARRLVRNLRAAREAVGDKIELMVDLHGKLNPCDAIGFCEQVEDLDLFVVEDPIRSENMAGYRQIRQRTRVPLAAGEQWANKWEFRIVIEEELVDYVRFDISICGGLTETKKIAAMAETHYIQILPHNPLGPVNTAAALHLCLACNNAGPQEVIYPPAEMLPDVFDCAFRLEGTCLTMPSAPGIGVRFDKKAAAKYPAEMTEPPHYRREDGAYTNC